MYLHLLTAEAGGGGGEPRSNFADTACFETVYTDNNGVATIKFTLPDDVTTYRVTVQSANEDLYLGENSIDITSKLDFYIQTTEPRGVKSTDELVLTATSVAEEVYEVNFEFTIEELGKTLTTTANTNSIASVNFGNLDVGTYHVLVKGTHEDQVDAIEYEFTIVESTQEVKDKTTINISNTTEITPSKNTIVLEIYNENIEQYLKYIDFIESTVTARLDTQIAYNEIQTIKEKYYGTSSSTSTIYMDEYYIDGIYRNNKNGSPDYVLTALINYYTNGYIDCYNNSLVDNDVNLFEYYLYAASNNETVLQDLLYLKDETDIDNYNKLLVTLSLEFMGDYQNAKELFNEINLTTEEEEEYASIIAIINTFINKSEAVTEINELIDENPSDDYLRFAILSFFQNNSAEIAEEETVTIKSTNLNETVTINGLGVKEYIISSEDLDTISFETEYDNIVVSYYYQTLLDNVKDDNIEKDVSIEIDGDIEKGETVNLVIDFSDCSAADEEGIVRIALPNSLRLAQDYVLSVFYRDYEDEDHYYMLNNNINYVTFYKGKDCSKITIPLIVSLEGDYTFENVVLSTEDGIYHISNSIEISIK